VGADGTIKYEAGFVASVGGGVMRCGTAIGVRVANGGQSAWKKAKKGGVLAITENTPYMGSRNSNAARVDDPIYRFCVIVVPLCRLFLSSEGRDGRKRLADISKSLPCFSSYIILFPLIRLM
jgi:hypothetical protein